MRRKSGNTSANGVSGRRRQGARHGETVCLRNTLLTELEAIVLLVSSVVKASYGPLEKKNKKVSSSVFPQA